MRVIASEYPVDESLRGWCWDRPPLRPRAFLGLSVYDIASYCPTGRDVWLRRVSGVRGEVTDGMLLGRDVHTVISCVISGVRACFSPQVDSHDACLGGVIEDCLRGCREVKWFGLLKDVAYLTFHVLAAEYMWSRVGVGFQPFLGWLSEVKVDGSPLGLSPNLRVDAIVSGNVVVDFKVGKPSDNQRLMLTAYALSAEANLEVPIDYGFLIYVSSNGSLSVRVEGVYIGPDLRREFIDSRDEVIDMLLSEREPPKAVTCPKTCPLKKHCMG